MVGWVVLVSLPSQEMFFVLSTYKVVVVLEEVEQICTSGNSGSTWTWVLRWGCEIQIRCTSVRQSWSSQR